MPAGRLTQRPHGADDDAAPQRELTLQSMWLQAVRHVMANTDDVGDRFPEEARRIHYGEIDERAIRGRASKRRGRGLARRRHRGDVAADAAALKGPLQ